MDIPILSLLICVPTVGALFILFTKSTQKNITVINIYLFLLV